MKHEAMKCNRGSYKVNKNTTISGETIIKELNSQNITLLPFTVDDFGSMGPLMKRYFEEVKTTPTLTQNNKLSKFTREGYIAYSNGRLCTKFSSLLKRSNKGWIKSNKDGWFGTTYQIIHPSDWGRHTLTQNINLAIVHHLKRSLKRVTNHRKLTQNKKTKIIGKQSLIITLKEPDHRKHHGKRKTKNKNQKQSEVGGEETVTEDLLPLSDVITTSEPTKVANDVDNILCYTYNNSLCQFPLGQTVDNSSILLNY